MRLTGENDSLRCYYDANASMYDTWMRSYDRFMLGDARQRLCAVARGRTLEVAVGTGLNLPYYPADVDLVAVDYSPEMLDVARRRAAGLARPVELRIEDAHALTFPDASFDTVVTTLFLSSVPDAQRAAAEIHRVLDAGGRLLAVDHVRSTLGPLAWLERVTEPWVAARTGVHLTRDPLDYLPATGFVVDHEQRSRLGVVQGLIARKV